MGCWAVGSLVGFLPMLGWYSEEGWEREHKCHFTTVMDYNFLVFLYIATILVPALIMAFFYGHIYSVVLKQLRQMFTVNGTGGGSMLRVLGAARKRDVKATKNLSIIILFFIICWFPLYTVNFVQAFCPSCGVSKVFMNFLIILTHLNSALNPLLYAYHLTDFRMALRNLLCEANEKDDLAQSRRSVYRIPNSTPKLPHRIFELETPDSELQETSRYRILTGEKDSRGSLDSLDERSPALSRTRSSPPTPTKPHILLDPT